MELPAELEAAIRAAPDDRAGYLVAADWLTSQGDPQGELIALSLSPRTDAVQSRISELRRQLQPLHVEDASVRFEWRWGFVFGVVMDSPPRDAARTVLRSPVARFVRKLVLELKGTLALEQFVEEWRALASLRTLVVQSRYWVLRGLVGLLQATQELEELVVGEHERPGMLALPRLRTLSIHRDALDVESKLPQLERLQLQLSGSDRVWLTPPELPSPCPALRRLSLAGAQPGSAESWEGIELARDLELFDVIKKPDDTGYCRGFIIDRIGERRGQPAGLLAMTGTDDFPAGTLFELTGRDQFVVGRLRGSDLVLRGMSINERHASLEPRSGWCIVDHGRPRATRVNGCVMVECALRSGDAIAFGDYEFRFLAGYDLDAQVAELRAHFGLST